MGKNIITWGKRCPKGLLSQHRPNLWPLGRKLHGSWHAWQLNKGCTGATSHWPLGKWHGKIQPFVVIFIVLFCLNAFCQGCTLATFRLQRCHLSFTCSTINKFRVQAQASSFEPKFTHLAAQLRYDKQMHTGFYPCPWWTVRQGKNFTRHRRCYASESNFQRDVNSKRINVNSTARSIIMHNYCIGELHARRGLNGCLSHACRVLLGRAGPTKSGMEIVTPGE